MLKNPLVIFAILAGIFIFWISGDSNAEAKKLALGIQNKVVLLDTQYKELEKVVNVENSPKTIYRTTLNIALNKLLNENKSDEATQSLVKQFKHDTTIKGTVFQKYKSEYDAVKGSPVYTKMKTKEAVKDDLVKLKTLETEVNRLRTTMTAVKYDENFIDYINIVASLSNEVDPVVISKSDLNPEAGIGSQMIGNPQYGEWKTDSNGNMFWNFAAAYMFFDFMSDSRRGYGGSYGSYGYHRSSNNYKYNSNNRYDNWNNKRNWSYYNDKYVKDYAKTTEKSKYNKWSKTGKTKYASSFKTNKTLANTTNKISKSSSSKFKSNFASTRSSSSQNKYRSPNIRSTSSSKSSRSGK